MRAMPAPMRRHRVRLHAVSRPAAGPVYAGLDGAPGVPYAGADGQGLPCHVSGPTAVEAEIAMQGVATLRRTLYCDLDPLLQEPDPGAPPRPLARGDCVTVIQPADPRRWLAVGPLVPATTSEGGAAVSYRVDLEAIA